jgi:hypothetical protein
MGLINLALSEAILNYPNFCNANVTIASSVAVPSFKTYVQFIALLYTMLANFKNHIQIEYYQIC